MPSFGQFRAVVLDMSSWHILILPIVMVRIVDKPEVGGMLMFMVSDHGLACWPARLQHIPAPTPTLPWAIDRKGLRLLATEETVIGRPAAAC
jgi:hypothetical protein